MQGQNDRLIFYQGIYYHNYRKEGHYSTSCIKSVVSGVQFEANRRAINELQGGSRQYYWEPAMLISLSPPQFALAIVASGGVRKKKKGKLRMNNIRVANMVVVK